MKFCHLSAAVRANVRWKVRENRQACFPRTITANFMAVFADMFPADLWFAKAAFILLSLCWAATTISRRQQCLFWQVPLSFLATQMQQASPQKLLYEFMGMKRNFYIEEHRFNPKIAPERPQLLLLLWQTCSRDWSQGLAPAPWLCPCSPHGAELRLCCPSSALWDLCWVQMLWLQIIQPFCLPLFFLSYKSSLCFAAVSSFNEHHLLPVGCSDQYNEK